MNCTLLLQHRPDNNSHLHRRVGCNLFDYSVYPPTPPKSICTHPPQVSPQEQVLRMEGTEVGKMSWAMHDMSSFAEAWVTKCVERHTTLSDLGKAFQVGECVALFRRSGHWTWLSVQVFAASF